MSWEWWWSSYYYRPLNCSHLFSGDQGTKDTAHLPKDFQVQWGILTNKLQLDYSVVSAKTGTHGVQHREHRGGTPCLLLGWSILSRKHERLQGPGRVLAGSLAVCLLTSSPEALADHGRRKRKRPRHQNVPCPWNLCRSHGNKWLFFFFFWHFLTTTEFETLLKYLLDIWIWFFCELFLYILSPFSYWNFYNFHVSL